MKLYVYTTQYCVDKRTLYIFLYFRSLSIPSISISISIHVWVLWAVPLTAVVVDQLLQVVELRARRDVEAAAVQLPDLVVFHVQPLGVVVVEDGQTVGPWQHTQTQMVVMGSNSILNGWH